MEPEEKVKFQVHMSGPGRTSTWIVQNDDFTLEPGDMDDENMDVIYLDEDARKRLILELLRGPDIILPTSWRVL